MHPPSKPSHPAGHAHHKRGFALVITLSLMMLLTIVAVGMLSLSTIALRSNSKQNAMNAARANARFALMLAIGELQKSLGPDTRISMTADQIPGDPDGEASAAPANQRHWTGVYQAWPDGAPADPRPAPEFVKWLVSGDSKATSGANYPVNTIGGDTVTIVSDKSGGADGEVVVPLIRSANPANTTASGWKDAIAWWVADQGGKALIEKDKPEPEDIALARADAQTVPGSALAQAGNIGNKPFSGLQGNDDRIEYVASWKSAELLGSNNTPADISSLFHSFTDRSSGLLTNVRSGGFRKDLSLKLQTNTVPDSSEALYTVGSESGINFQELWGYYNLAAKGIKRASTSISYTTGGGSIATDSHYLEVRNKPLLCATDDFFYFKQPVIIRYDLVISSQVLTDPVDKKNYLNIVTDPIITLWNPLDIPVVVPSRQMLSVKYWSVPYDLVFSKNGVAQSFPMAGILGKDGNFMSMEIRGPIAFRPGEVIKFSQSGSTVASTKAGDLHRLVGTPGFNYGKGLAWKAVDRSGKSMELSSSETLRFEQALPNDLTAGETPRSGKVLPTGFKHYRHFSLTHHEYYIGKDRNSDETKNDQSLGIGNAVLDYDYGNARLQPGQVRGNTEDGTKPPGDRYNALSYPDVFPAFSPAGALGDGKIPLMAFSFHAKTESTDGVDTRCLSRFNPKALHVDFYNLSDEEKQMLPYAYRVEMMGGTWKNSDDTLEVDDSGRSYFGGGMNFNSGSSYVCTHSIPREPIYSLAALQNSFANGFNINRPVTGSYATTNAREPLLPQISHAIGNSIACPLLEKDQTSGTISGGRPIADHSYLANQALWDEWFFSGIAPQSTKTFSNKRTFKQVAADFFNEQENGALPVSRYKPNLRGQDADELVGKYFNISEVNDPDAITDIASYLTVDGMFNINSTSVEAWKSLLGSRIGRQIATRTSDGEEKIQAVGDGLVPVSSLGTPTSDAYDGNGDIKDSAQWTGWRSLTSDEIESLAEAIVREVRKRGPFISLADFVNRRPGDDAELAKSGAIQSALDSDDVPINAAYNSGSRSTDGGTAFSFREADEGPKSYGAPGVVKQADILTPLAPILSARSDTFLVRGFGQVTDSNNNVIASACCEAVVQRGAEFVDPTDPPESEYDTINQTNQDFGRRFKIESFRWLTHEEI